MEFTCIAESSDEYYKPFTFESATTENNLLGFPLWLPLVVSKKMIPGDKNFMCTMGCNKSFDKHNALIKHIKVIHLGETPYKCTFEGCDKSYSYRGSLEKHKQIHTGQKLHVCIECNKAFSDKDNFKRHNRVHTGEKRYACTICKKSYAHNFSLNKHMQTHAESDSDFEC